MSERIYNSLTPADIQSPVPIEGDSTYRLVDRLAGLLHFGIDIRKYLPLLDQTELAEPIKAPTRQTDVLSAILFELEIVGNQ